MQACGLHGGMPSFHAVPLSKTAETLHHQQQDSSEGPVAATVQHGTASQSHSATERASPAMTVRDWASSFWIALLDEEGESA